MKAVIPIIFSTLFIFGFSATAQTFRKVTYNPKNCLLTIKPGKWVQKGGKELLPITIILTNNSNDTLKYASELCFQDRFGYLTDTTNFSDVNKFDDCLKNWPVTVAIPPHQIKKNTFIAIKKYSGNKPVNLQMATTLQLVNIDIHQEMINRVYKQGINEFKKNFEEYEKQLSVYKTQNQHTFLSNIVKVQ